MSVLTAPHSDSSRTTNPDHDQAENHAQHDFFAPIGHTAQSIHAVPHPSDNASDPGDGVDDQEGRCEGVDSIESLCMSCGKNGMTRMLLTSIPFFKQVIVVSFNCPHCHHSNNSIQSAGSIQPLGAIYTVKNLCGPADLNRQIVKSEHCIVRLKELELEVPKGTGKLTTVEGLVRDAIEDLSLAQPVRKHTQPEVYEKIEELLRKLERVLDGNFGPLELELEDCTGNSFVEAVGGLGDPKWAKREVRRTAAQNAELGLMPADPAGPPVEGLTEDYEPDGEEVYSFPSSCTACGHTLETRMKKLAVPHFKEMILMATHCETCGYKDSEVKSGAAISTRGTKLVLRVTGPEDLSRDVLKSETAAMEVPEIGLELNPGTLGGRFTTLEGLLRQVYDELDQKVFARGDSVQPRPVDVNQAPEVDRRVGMEAFLEKLQQAINCSIEYTVIIDDPLSNSYIQNLFAPDPDPGLTKTEYDRTFEQNEELGLNDIKTENY